MTQVKVVHQQREHGIADIEYWAEAWLVDSTGDRLRLLHSGGPKDIAAWLKAQGYSYVVGSNGRWTQ